MLDLLGEFFVADDLPSTCFGIRFPNPVGLAAGMDKNGIAVPAWRALGFGFCEVGSVTKHFQPGNPKPRLFRIPDSEALVNRMGLNNCGADALAESLAKTSRNSQFPLGINIGKSKRTSLAESSADFVYSLEKLWHLGDFFVVNVSCPNVRGGRDLQEKQYLQSLLADLCEANGRMADVNDSARKPLLIKISPDLSFDAIDEIVESARSIPLAGVVATNTTITPQRYRQSGAHSGQPLRKRNVEIIRRIADQTKGELAVIGVGGICDAKSAWEKITAGAHLCQIYSGLVFHGPGLISEIIRGLANQLQLHKMKTFEQAIGSRLPFIRTD